jgi:Clr5-like protein
MASQVDPHLSSFNMQISPFDLQYPIFQSVEIPGNAFTFGESSLAFPPAMPGFQHQPDCNQPFMQRSEPMEHSTSMPPRKRTKVSTMRVEDWKPFQPRIVELYTIDNRSIPEILDIMEEEFKKRFTYVLRPFITV